MDTIRTLLVESAGDGARSVEALLSAPGPAHFSLEQAQSLRTALNRVLGGDIDVVLLDLALPDSAGVESIERLHAAAPEVPIVVLSDADDDELALRALQAGAEDYIVRGRSDFAGLPRTVHYLLRHHRMCVDRESNRRMLERSEDRFRNVIARSPDGVAVVSLDGAILYANPSAARLLGGRVKDLRAEMMGFPFGSSPRLEFETEDERVIEAHVAQGEWDAAPVWVVNLFEISAHKRAHAALEGETARIRETNAVLERIANIDPLTGLLNRRGLDAALALDVRRKLRSGEPIAAVLLDLDDFKHINDTFGHSVGDEVLRQLAVRLKESLRPTDHIGRIGGDEFLVLLPDTRYAEAFQVSQRLRLAVSAQALLLPAGPERLTASLGLAVLSSDILAVDDVLARTSSSLQHSKRLGKNRLSTLGQGAHRDEADFDELSNELQLEGALRVLQQPILRLSDESVFGWELTPRKSGGLFEAPRDFFRLARECNRLAEVDLNCLGACIEQSRRLPDSVRCHINLLPSTLLEGTGERVVELLASGGGSKQYCLELSEQHLIGEPVRLRERVQMLKDAGIRVAIDDVGYGRSSLENLIVLEPDVVKIDRTFLHQSSREAGQIRSLRRMISVVEALGCELVVDGIETREGHALVLELGVRLGQGALWGPPAPVASHHGSPRRRVAKAARARSNGIHLVLDHARDSAQEALGQEAPPPARRAGAERLGDGTWTG